METTKEYHMDIGDSAPDFTLPATDGSTYTLKSFDKPILVVFFTCNHCPYARAYEKRVMALQDEFENNVQFAAINSNDEVNYPQDDFEHMKKLATEQNYNFPYLRDESQEVAKAYGGECTPHFFVFDKDRKLQYQGRFDDNWENEDEVMSTDLKDAIKALIDGKDVENAVTGAIGCSIKWKE